MDNFSGQQIKGYELLERIGTGGFGAVYRARQTTVGREVAIKIILPGFANQPEFIRRFESEAQIVAQLEHLHIIPLYDYWRDPTGAYLVMRLFRGGSLRDALQSGPFQLAPAARLLDQISAGLLLAHRSEIIHRDLKPGNILLDEDGNAYLADFGIAKVIGNLGTDLSQGGVIGSLDYISPEQARSEPVTPRTDIYSLGVVLYEMLIGEHPFPNSTPVERLYKHISEPLPAITQLNDVGDAVNEVIQKATAKNPAMRFADVLEMAAAFRDAAKISSPESGSNIVEQLTYREQEVLHLIVEGKSNQEIAQTLVITVGTVKWYVNQIFNKLGVRNRVQAIVRARELHLVVPGMSSEISEASAAESLSVSLPEPVNPYKGLRAFLAADHRHFFGREGLVEKLVSALTPSSSPSGSGRSSEELRGEGRFLAVVGPSGSGKSSVVRAGLIPALWRGDLPGSERWFIVDMIPGAHPLDELEVALIKVAANQSSNLHDQLVRDPRGLLRTAKLILPDDGSELVLVIDQFEEVFTLVEDEATRAQFLDLLTTAATDPRSRVRIIITLRADFYDRPLHYHDFGELVRANMETILPLSAEGLTRAIRRPAEIVGMAYEEGLIPTIVEEIHYQSGALPLLQYALTELFDRREGRLLTRQAYEDMGGVTGALAKRAEDIYSSLTPAGQEAARQMFLRLVTLGEGVEDTRRRVARSELMSISPSTPTELPQGEGWGEGGDLMDELIDTYTAYRLLSLDNDPTSRTPTVEVAHEAILREWERLRGWLDESRADVRLQRVLSNLTLEWLGANRDSSFLLRGARLSQFESWAEGTDLALTVKERAFLDTSLKARQEQESARAAQQAREGSLEKRSRNFLRALVGVFAFATVIAVFLSVFAFYQRDLATARELAAQSLRQLEFDAERSILLALTSLQTAYTSEGEEILHTVLQSSRTLLTIPAVGGAYHSLAYSPDGSRLAASSDEYSVISLDAATGQEVFTVGYLGDGTVLGSLITYSPDGAVLAVGEGDGGLWILDAASGETLMNLVGHSDRFNALVFSPDGTRIATANSDDSIRMWDAGNGELLYTLDSFAGVAGGNYVQFSNDGEYLITYAGAFIVDVDAAFGIVEAATGEVLSRLPVRNAGLYKVSPDGSLLAVASRELLYGAVEFWDFNAFLEGKAVEPVFISPGNPLLMIDIAFSPDGSLLATSNQDGTVTIWSFSPEGVEELFTLTSIHTLFARIAFSPDGTTLATLSGTAIQTWDVTPGGTKELLTLTGHTARVDKIVYSPDGALLATASSDGTVRIWNSGTGELVQILSPIPNTGEMRTAAFNPEGTRLAAAGQDQLIWVWDVGTWQVVLTLSGHEAIENYDTAGGLPGIHKVLYSPDGRTLASVGEDGTARLWDARTGELLKTLSIHPTQHGGTGLAFSPDGTLLATATDDLGPVRGDNTGGLVKIWDFESFEELLNIPGPRVFALAFSPDGTQLVSVGDNHTLVFHDTTTGEELFSLSGHTARVIGAVFSPDGSRLYSTAADLPKVWDLASRQELYSLFGHTGVVPGLSLSPDGTRLATSGMDGTARVYVVDIDDLITLALERVTRWFTPAECLEFLHTEACPPDPRP
ncbi:MAG TPA: protein kinase [Anaerolineales bacterium]|nr:protein kinase [Anaerolineales bacterium]